MCGLCSVKFLIFWKLKFSVSQQRTEDWFWWLNYSFILFFLFEFFFLAYDLNYLAFYHFSILISLPSCIISKFGSVIFFFSLFHYDFFVDVPLLFLVHFLWVCIIFKLNFLLNCTFYCGWYLIVFGFYSSLPNLVLQSRFGVSKDWGSISEFYSWIIRPPWKQSTANNSQLCC